MPRASLLSRKPTWGNPVPPAASPLTFPAPVQGINAVDAMAGMSPTFSTYQVNMVPVGVGAQVRSGYRQHATVVGDPVRTIIPFMGLASANNKLFGTTEDGIYDFTTAGTTPWTPALTFGSTGGLAGWGNQVNFTSDAGTHYGFYADEVNGLFRIPEAGSWAAVTDITGVTEGNLVFVAQYKKRLWFVERDTANAWYLPAGTISGAAAKFSFGSKFVHGGTLVGLWVWTADGGLGIDDYLVAVSSTGDVVTYRFTDPADITSYEQTAQYYIGAPPVGRRIASQYGGELFLLSQYGVTPLSKLVAGRPLQDQDIMASRNITPLFVEDMEALRNTRGWDIVSVPAQNVLLINTPKVTGYPYKQYAMGTDTNGWCVFNGLEYISGDTYLGVFYIGDADGVNIFAGSEDEVDRVTLTGLPIEFSMLTVFADAGAPGATHQCQFIRPVWRDAGQLTYNVEARYDYNAQTLLLQPQAPLPRPSTWDFGVWDTAVWGTGPQTTSSVRGAGGVGRAVGVALAGRTQSPTTLLRIDTILTPGGML